jgi:DNA segregation ATPase FtsK/SpoIIIE-like protein
MTSPLLYDRQRAWFVDLIRSVRERSATDAAIREAYRNGSSLAEQAVQKIRKDVPARREKAVAAAEDVFREAERIALERFQADVTAAERERTEARKKIQAQYTVEEEKIQGIYQEAIWTATSYFEAGEKQAREALQVLRGKATAAQKRVETVWQEVNPFLRRCGIDTSDLEADTPHAGVLEDHVEGLNVALADVDRYHESLVGLFLPKLLTLPFTAGMVAAIFIVCLVPALFLERPAIGLIAGGFAGLVLAASVRGLLGFMAGRQVRRVATPLVAALDTADVAARRLTEHAEAVHEKAIKDLADKHAREQRQVENQNKRRADELNDRRAGDQTAAEVQYRQAIHAAEHNRDEALTRARDRRDRIVVEATSARDRDLAAAEDHYTRTLRKLAESRDRDRNEMMSRWNDGMNSLVHEFNDLKTTDAELFPAWDQMGEPYMPGSVPRGIRLGQITADLALVPGSKGLEDPRFPANRRWDLPAFVPFPEKGGLLLKARDQGRNLAVATLQALMLRFMMSLPPGKVRFTIIDPVGLGENFAAFMHLADYDENLVGGRIWTEPGQIEQRLGDLTAHMENVIQKYLRNQYRSLEEYNAQAGEVAEPYRVLVVANFPVNFTPDAARRLVSIMGSGPGCGVYTLMSVDTRQPMPHGFNAADLDHAAGMELTWKDDRWSWKDDPCGHFPLAVDAPPETDAITRLAHVAGARAKDSYKVEVPFTFVAPPPEKTWTFDSRNGLSVPIGRAGATKRQALQLGRGTAQHALVAGKTGSGKSTLLHCIITNLALHYRPDEVELYLIDFKKGVEFKPYAEHHLPHARVIAIESEREFGLSVLQRLDGILRERGDKFRAAGVSDIAAYRAHLEAEAGPSGVVPPVPRIMLIVDEFQEFFVDDDKLAQEAALLLDRLVRQGRAFGVHVLLGSQTLGGAYSLARATIDQMAVRVALQCSEADAQLILSKENNAARLLGRPGEAIYNDANGRVEGNDPFQVVWLPDHQREEYLRDLAERVKQISLVEPPSPAIIFEGNAPADLPKNVLLRRALEGPRQAAKSPVAWLGESVAIKDPTTAVFRPQGGGNLLLIGQHEDAARAILTSTILSLAAQTGPDTRFLILDGTLPEDPLGNYLSRLVDGFPHPVAVAGSRDFASALGEFTAELKARSDSTRLASPWFLIGFGLQRFRDLRKADDDFGFGRKEGPASPADQFASILRDGPPLSIHSILWCDTLTNLTRFIDRQLLRECEQRVLFQMSAADSSTLIDSPLAARLGRHRALYHTEQGTQPEKFRPYDLPPADWLAWAKQQLRR